MTGLGSRLLALDLACAPGEALSSQSLKSASARSPVYLGQVMQELLLVARPDPCLGSAWASHDVNITSRGVISDL